MKNTFLTYGLLLLALLCVSCISCTKGKTNISSKASKIITKMDIASGANNLKNVSSMKMKISLDMPAQNLKGTGEVIVVKDKVISKVSIGPMTIENGYDGKVAWSKDLMLGLRDLDGQEAFDIKVQTLDAMMKPEEIYDSIDAGEDITFDNKECFTLIFKKEGTFDKTFYIEKSTYLPLGLAAKSKSPTGEVSTVSYFKNYKTAKNGYKYASEVLIDVKIMKMIMKITSIEFNQKFDDSVFVKPKK